MNLRRIPNSSLIDWEKLDNLPLNTNDVLLLKADKVYVDNENNILQWQINWLNNNKQNKLIPWINISIVWDVINSIWWPAVVTDWFNRSYFTATEWQTEFISTFDFKENTWSVLVFVNWVLQQSTIDYIEEWGNKITFINPLIENTLVQLTTWVKWEQWNKWDRWDRWEIWPVWPQWPIWEIWPVWPQGIQGLKWDTWEQGIQWIQWPKWDTGEQWIQGIQWVQWEVWPMWPQWPIWLTGNWILNTVLLSTVGKVKTYRITYTDLTTFDFTVTDWADWSWAWDMLKSENLSWLANYATARTNLWLDTTVNQTDSTDKRFMTDAQKNKLDAITWTNTWDNATNSQYSWLATSKQDTLVNQTNIKSINWQSLLWAWDIEITSWWLTYSAINSSQAITNWNYYWVTCTGDIILTLADWTSSGQNLSIKKLDNTAYTITITGNIEWETSIIMDTQYESLDLFWNWTYYLIK